MTDRIIVACTAVLAVVYLYATSQIPELEIGDPLGPKAFPRLIGAGMLLAAGVLAFEIWKDRETPQQSEAPAGKAHRFYWVLAGVSAWSLLYYWALPRLGYVVDSTIYLLALMCWFNRGKWLINAVTAVTYSLLSYYMFLKLDVHLPAGILPL